MEAVLPVSISFMALLFLCFLRRCIWYCFTASTRCNDIGNFNRIWLNFSHKTEAVRSWVWKAKTWNLLDDVWSWILSFCLSKVFIIPRFQCKHGKSESERSRCGVSSRYLLPVNLHILFQSLIDHLRNNISCNCTSNRRCNFHFHIIAATVCAK